MYCIRKNSYPFAIIASLFLILYTFAFANFFSQFPTSYAWSDLMIGYQAGYVRRGFLGQIAFLLDGSLGARSVLATLVALSYIAVVIAFTTLARRTSAYIGMLFLLSPATLLFPLLDPNAFGRKDAFI